MGADSGNTLRYLLFYQDLFLELDTLERLELMLANAIPLSHYYVIRYFESLRLLAAAISVSY